MGHFLFGGVEGGSWGPSPPYCCIFSPSSLLNVATINFTAVILVMLVLPCSTHLADASINTLDVLTCWYEIYNEGYPVGQYAFMPMSCPQVWKWTSQCCLPKTFSTSRSLESRTTWTTSRHRLCRVLRTSGRLVLIIKHSIYLCILYFMFRWSHALTLTCWER